MNCVKVVSFCGLDYIYACVYKYMYINPLWEPQNTSFQFWLEENFEIKQFGDF